MTGLRTGRSSARQVPPTPNRRLVLVAAFLCIITAGCSSSAHRIAPDGNEIAALLAEVEAGRIRSGSRVRVTGVVTDDDAERRLAFIADAKRAIAVDTAPGGLAAAQGARVTIEGRLEKSGSVTHLSDPVLISSVAGALPAIALVDPASVFDGPLTGRRVELTSRVQTAEMIGGRLHLTLTTHGIQLDADVRRVEATATDWRSLIGTDIRFRGVVVPAVESPADRSHDRIVIASLGDVDAVGARAAPSAGPRRLLTTAAAIKGLSANEAAAGMPSRFAPKSPSSTLHGRCCSSRTPPPESSFSRAASRIPCRPVARATGSRLAASPDPENSHRRSPLTKCASSRLGRSHVLEPCRCSRCCQAARTASSSR